MRWLRSNTVSSGRWDKGPTKSEKRWSRVFQKKHCKHTVMTASSGLDSSVDQDRDDETRNDDNFDDGKTRALKYKMTGEHTIITWWKEIKPHIMESLIFSQDVKGNTAHWHSTLLNRKKWQHTFHPTTYCHWLSKHRRDKIQTQATLSTDLLRK